MRYHFSALLGLDNQTECIPLRYFFELLRQGKRLVFTGELCPAVSLWIVSNTYKLDMVTAITAFEAYNFAFCDTCFEHFLS